MGDGAAASGTITQHSTEHHFSHRHHLDNIIDAGLEWTRACAHLLKQQRSRVKLGRILVLPHLSAEIKSPNKSTMIKDLLSSNLGAHKVEQ